MTSDLTNQENVSSLMKISKSVDEWNKNCDTVKAANGGSYPVFWFSAIMLSGLYTETKKSW